MEQYT